MRSLKQSWADIGTGNPPSTSQHERLAFQYITSTRLESHTFHVFNSQDGGLRWRFFYQCSSPSPPIHRKFLSQFQSDSRTDVELQVREAAQLTHVPDGPLFLGDGSLAGIPTPKLIQKGIRPVLKVVDDKCL